MLVSTIAVFAIGMVFYPVYGLTDFEKKELYEEGEYLFSIGSFQDALSNYEKILDDDPNYSDAVGAKAAVFHRWGDYENAIGYYEIAISLNSSNFFFLSDYGNALLSLGDDVSAEKNLRKSLLLNPGFVDALNGLANVYSYRQDYPNELRYRQAALVADPKNVESIVGLGNAFLAMGQHVESKRQYHLALQIDPVNSNALIGLGNAHFQIDDHSSALDFYNAALALDPQNMNAMRGISLVQLHLGEIDESIKFDQNLRELEQRQSNFADLRIPNWVKNIFVWYGQDLISEDDVLNAIEYLLEENFIKLN